MDVTIIITLTCGLAVRDTFGLIDRGMGEEEESGIGESMVHLCYLILSTRKV